MRKDVQEKYIALFKKDESLTQKEVAARLNCTVAAASKNLRTLFERGILKVSQQPGMSMRYTLKGAFELIRSPNGNPLYYLYDASLSRADRDAAFINFAKTLVTQYLDDSLSQDLIQRQYLPVVRDLNTLLEILINASPEQLKVTREAVKELNAE